MFFDLTWWELCILVLSIFIGCLLINYIIKKVNEAKIEQRLSRLLQKASVSTQVQDISLEMEKTRSKTLQANPDSNSPVTAGISLVFNKEENMLLSAKRYASTVRGKKSKTWNLDDVPEISQDDTDMMYRKISIISVRKHGSNQVVARTCTTNTRSIVIKDSNEIYATGTTNSPVLGKSDDTLVHKLSSLSFLNQNHKMYFQENEIDVSKFKDSKRDSNMSVKFRNSISKDAQGIVEALSLKTSDNGLKAKSYLKRLETNETVKENSLVIDTAQKESVISQMTSSKSYLTIHKLEPKSAVANLKTISTNNFDPQMLIESDASDDIKDAKIFSQIAFHSTVQTIDFEPKDDKNKPTGILKNLKLRSSSKILDKPKPQFSLKTEEILPYKLNDICEVSGKIIFKDSDEVSNTSSNYQCFTTDLAQKKKEVISQDENIYISDSSQSKLTASEMNLITNNFQVSIQERTLSIVPENSDPSNKADDSNLIISRTSIKKSDLAHENKNSVNNNLLLLEEAPIEDTPVKSN